MKKEITINISGLSASGKSRILYLLKMFLRKQGIEVEHELNFDYLNESDFDKNVGRNIFNVVDSFKDSRKIIIKETQCTHLS